MQVLNMSISEASGDSPRRKIPKFRPTKAQLKDMKTAAAILNMLSEKPEVLKKLGDEYLEASNAPEEERDFAEYELRQNVLRTLTENIKQIPEEELERNIDIVLGPWWPWWPRYRMPPIIKDYGYYWSGEGIEFQPRGLEMRRQRRR